MYELLKTSAANIHSATDWAIIFTLLECVGAGAPPPRVVGKPSHVNESGGKNIFYRYLEMVPFINYIIVKCEYNNQYINLW
jgi:hypothetical protein